VEKTAAVFIVRRRCRAVFHLERGRRRSPLRIERRALSSSVLAPRRLTRIIHENER
jgi:hypothetical protein